MIRGGLRTGGIDDDDPGPGLNGWREMGPFDLPPGAFLARDLAYGNDPLQRLDAYLPARSGSAPVLIMAHGGGWSRGNKRLWRVVKNKVTHWVAKGTIVVSTNYRLLPAADPLTQADDLAQAVAFVQSQLSAWGGDPARVILMGHSSGAHLASLLTADPAISARMGASPWRATVSLDSGAMNVEQIMRARHAPLYDAAFSDDPGYWRQASPTQRLVSKPVAPMLLVCSTQRFDSGPQARELAEKAVATGGRAELLSMDLSHAAINDLLGTRGAYTDAVDAFLRSVGAG